MIILSEIITIKK